MALNTLRCNDCGNLDIEVFTDGSGLGRCRACGALVLLPSRENPEIINLLNIAYLQRAACNFDAAIQTYRFVLEKEPKELAAYEGMLLSKYGIEYVRDRRYNKFVPTCHRTHFKPVYEDEDFKRYLELASEKQKSVFAKRAGEIDELQKAIAKQLEGEEAFDVFVCYKAADDNGQPTEDSLLAADVFDALKKRGHRVFFAERTLENRLGENYEPIIFKALQTSQVFILVGTSRENVESVWVRNEWSRFLDRIGDPTDRDINSNCFIPVFKDMSPYDMPKLNNRTVQGVDAGKLGWLKLITDGVDRLVRRDNGAEAEQKSEAAAAGPAPKSEKKEEFTYDWNRTYDPFIAGPAKKAETGKETYTRDEFLEDILAVPRRVANTVKLSVKHAFRGNPDRAAANGSTAPAAPDPRQAEKDLKRAGRGLKRAEKARKRDLKFAKKLRKQQRRAEKLRRREERLERFQNRNNCGTTQPGGPYRSGEPRPVIQPIPIPPRQAPQQQSLQSVQPPRPEPMQQYAQQPSIPQTPLKRNPQYTPVSRQDPMRTPFSEPRPAAPFARGPVPTVNFSQEKPAVRSRPGRDVASYLFALLAVAALVWSFYLGDEEKGGNLALQAVLWICFVLFVILFLTLRFHGRDYAKGSTASAVRGAIIAICVLLCVGTMFGLISRVRAQWSDGNRESGMEIVTVLDASGEKE